MLQMKSECEKCNKELSHTSDAMICSYECTFCVDCTQEFDKVCPNCNGELTARPKSEGKV